MLIYTPVLHININVFCRQKVWISEETQRLKVVQDIVCHNNRRVVYAQASFQHVTCMYNYTIWKRVPSGIVMLYDVVICHHILYAYIVERYSECGILIDGRGVLWCSSSQCLWQNYYLAGRWYDSKRRHILKFYRLTSGNQIDRIVVTNLE